MSNYIKRKGFVKHHTFYEAEYSALLCYSYVTAAAGNISYRY